MPITTTEVEVLYYYLYNSVLLGESNNAKMYLSMLRDDFENNPKAFNILGDKFSHLKQLGYIVDNNLVVKTFNYEKDSQKIEKTKEDDDRAEKEKDLVKNIVTNIHLLKKLFNASDEFFVYNIEHPTQFGFVDIVVKDKTTMYLIEVKKNEARYSVVSQIDKYILDFKLNLILKIWDEIIGVVIANSFLDQVAKELTKLNVIPVKYNLKDEVLSFKRII